MKLGVRQRDQPLRRRGERTPDGPTMLGVTTMQAGCGVILLVALSLWTRSLA
jgi:hypothetical protein